MLPTISVITPSYNQGQFIRQTVESVLSQNYPALEYLIVDGLSTDATLEILQPYQSRLTLLSEADSGQTNAINKGLRLTTGSIVCWLNSDDYFLPGALHTVGKFFEEHPEQLWLTGDCLIVNDKGVPIQQSIQRYKRSLRQLPTFVYLGMTNAVCQPATFWRRSAHDTLGYLDESLHYTMDYDWWLRLKTLQPPAVIRQVLTAFRVHGQSKGSQFSEQFAEDYSVLQRHVRSMPVRAMHQLHNQLITAAYHLIK
ncbi:glycosyltransferase family 2 protein [Spirosoma sp.]|uniref:glycosyltransferase family 2 protein n=1 Tax=Spirosoma sp. TaxID=1899569 RepID=UPI003B3A6913